VSDERRPVPPLPSRRLLCANGHRYWPVQQSPGLSICLTCGVTEWLPLVKRWPAFKGRR
jgi:hypothetical protein